MSANAENQTRTICRACGFVQGSVPNMKYCERRDPRDPDGKDTHEFYMSPEQPLSGDQDWKNGPRELTQIVGTPPRQTGYVREDIARDEVEKLTKDLADRDAEYHRLNAAQAQAIVTLTKEREEARSLVAFGDRLRAGSERIAVAAEAEIEKLRAELAKIATETAHTYGHSEECEATLCPDDCGCDDAGPHRDCECSTGVMNAAHMLARRALGYPDGVPWEASADQRHLAKR